MRSAFDRLSDLARRNITLFPYSQIVSFSVGKGSGSGRTLPTWRNKALGNSMAVNCMRWIGQRILAVDEILREKKCGGVKMTEDTHATYETILALQMRGDYDELRNIVRFAMDAITNDDEPLNLYDEGE